MVLLTVGLISSNHRVSAEPGKQGEPVEYQTHPYDIHEYYDGIPDLVNTTEVNFWFYQMHWFITGA